MTKPVILKHRQDIPRDSRIIDAFASSLKELFFIDNPNLKKTMPEAKKLLDYFLKKSRVKEIWIYFPDTRIAVKSPPEDLYFHLRTARNKNIINKKEQNNYRNIKVGIAGLSVGSGVLSALVISGGPKTLKIADFDVVEVGNLNRIRAKLTDIGASKVKVAAREVWELDPFADVHLWEKGITKENLEDFILGKPRLDVFIDEMDSIDLKILSRFVCRENRIPVVMATDNGDGVIVDIERFDLEPRRHIFHGLIDDMDPEKITNIDFKTWIKIATRIVGPEYLTERMQESLLEVGKTIPAVPQLGTSANMAGSAVSFVIRSIANKQNMPSGRYSLSLEEKLIPEYNNRKNIIRRQQKTGEFKKKFGKNG